MKRKAKRLPAVIEEQPAPPVGLTSYGYWRGWNVDGSPQVIEDGLLVTPFVPEAWHKRVYGGGSK